MQWLVMVYCTDIFIRSYLAECYYKTKKTLELYSYMLEVLFLILMKHDIGNIPSKFQFH